MRSAVFAQACSELCRNPLLQAQSETYARQIDTGSLMRITIVQGAFLPVPPIMGGAVEKIWFALGKEFASRGHQVIHISRQHEMLKKDEVIDGVHHIRIPGFDTPHSLIKLKWYDLLYSRRAVKMIP